MESCSAAYAPVVLPPMTNQQPDLELPPCEMCGERAVLFKVRRDVHRITKWSWGHSHTYDWFVCPDCRDAHNLERLENEIKQLKEQHDRQL